MSTHELEQRLGATLRERADHLGGDAAPLTLDGVRRRATSIRRRRRAATGAGVLAAAVAVVAVGVGTAGLWRDPMPVQPVAPSGAPADSWLLDGVVTRPDGSTVTVPFGETDLSEAPETTGSVTYGVLTDGRVVGSVFDPDTTSNTVVVVAPDGTVESEHPSGFGVVRMGPGDRTAAWIGADGRARVLESGDAEPVELSRVPDARNSTVQGVLGSDCVDGGCRVLAGQYANGASRVVDATGVRQLDLPEQMRVTDISPDGALWAVDLVASNDPQFGCAALYDPALGEVVARNCETSSLEFSPDGEHLLGGRGDNAVLNQALVLDRDLETVATFEPQRGEALSGAGWADADHVWLVRAGFEGTDWRLERVAIDGGDVQQVEGPVRGQLPEIGPTIQLSE